MNKPTIDSRSSQRYGNNSSPTNSTDSAPIPLPRTHLHRTRSEVALEEANKLADWRENQMYHRLLTGMIRRSQEKGLDQNPKIIRSMENLVQTQASPISSLDNSSKHNEEWGIISCSPDENQGARNSHDPHSSSSKNLSSVSSWNSAMSGGYSSSSLSRRPSRIRLSLTPLRESLKASFKDEGIFDLEM